MAKKKIVKQKERSLTDQLALVNYLLTNSFSYEKGRSIPCIQNIALVYDDKERRGVCIKSFLCCDEDTPYSEEMVLQNVAAYAELLKEEAQRALAAVHSIPISLLDPYAPSSGL